MITAKVYGLELKGTAALGYLDGEIQDLPDTMEHEALDASKVFYVEVLAPVENEDLLKEYTKNALIHNTVKVSRENLSDDADINLLDEDLKVDKLEWDACVINERSGDPIDSKSDDYSYNDENYDLDFVVGKIMAVNAPVERNGYKVLKMQLKLEDGAYNSWNIRNM